MASQTDDPIAKELAEFSIDRIFFLEDRNLNKTKFILMNWLLSCLLFILILKKASPKCVFSMDKKRLMSFDHELGRYGFDENLERAMAQFLQIYGTDLLYDFAFGDKIEISKSKQALDLFNYDRQIN